jgi:hypothetical protein
MWTYDKALSVIRVYVAEATDDRGVVLEDCTLDRPYGWVFCYQSRAYVETGDRSQAFAGNAPIIFNRVSGELRVTGTGDPLEDYLRKYEAELPPAVLQMTPQARPRGPKPGAA